MRYFGPGFALCLLLLTNNLSAQSQFPLPDIEPQTSFMPHAELPTPDMADDRVQAILGDRSLIFGTMDESPLSRNGLPLSPESNPGYINRLHPGSNSESAFSWQSSGGGGGLLCYANQESFAEAFEEAQTLGILSDEAIARADAIFTHERWEENGQMFDFPLDYGVHMMDSDGEGDQSIAPETALSRLGEQINRFNRMTLQDHMDRIDNHVYQNSPVFYQRLAMLRKMIPLSEWQPAKLTPVKDFQLVMPSNKMPPYMERCLHWPIVVRKFDFSPGVEKPIQIFYEKAIWDKLSELDKALLIYHEDVYALANYVGHTQADRVREFIRNIFSLRYWSLIGHTGRHRSHEARLFQSHLTELFGDYPLFFAGEFRAYVKDAPEATPGSWYRSYLAALERSNQELHACINKHKGKSQEWHKEQAKIIGACNDLSYHKILMGDGEQMSEETAFVLMLRFMVDFENVTAGSEWFFSINPDSPDVPHPFQAQQFTRACSFIHSDHFEKVSYLKDYPHLLKKARAYCQRHRKAQSFQ